MEIRPAVDADVPAIRAILDALLDTTSYEWTERHRTDDDVRGWLDAHPVTLVADDGGEVVGVAAYGPFRDWDVREGYRLTVEHTVHVRGDRWGSGLGRRLLQALIDRARAEGFHAMVAAVDGTNTGSIAFHERLGFVPVGRLPEIGVKHGRWLDLVLLQLLLDEDPPGDR